MKAQTPFYKIIIYGLICGLILLLLYKCPFKFILGISCPGCGMTRALLSCLKFEFVSAFNYHPLFGIVIIAGITWCLDHFRIIQIPTKIKNILFYVLCALFIIVYFIRLLHGSNIVCIDLKSGLVYKVIQHIYFNYIH